MEKSPKFATINGGARRPIETTTNQQILLNNTGHRYHLPPAALNSSNANNNMNHLNRRSKSGDRRGRFAAVEGPPLIRGISRPAVIEEDLVLMERRKRVQEVLQSKDFCDELNEVITKSNSSEDFMNPPLPLPDLFLPPGQMPFVNLASALPRTVIPIADIPRQSEWSRQERQDRCKLASLYRLCDLFQWSQGIYNHITRRLSDSSEEHSPEILINPFGLLYHEISAASLIKISLKGDVLDAGSTNLGINQAGYVLHSAIHEARPDVRCVLHLHTAVVSAVSSMTCGLLPICQEAMIIGPVAYHDYKGIVSEEEEKASIVEDLGDKNVMLLRNHGFVTCGRSVEDALHLAFHTVIACETQIRAARAGLERINVPSEESVAKAYAIARQGGGGVNRTASPSVGETTGISSPQRHCWGIGELEWEAWMRLLDSAGYRTGHSYRHPAFKAPYYSGNAHQDASKSASMYNLSNVALYPAVTPSHGTLRSSMSTFEVPPHRMAMLRGDQDRTRWITSSGSYQQVKVFESGTDNPRMFIKWIPEGSNDIDKSMVNSTSTIKIDAFGQFVPLGTNPQEFREKRQQMKDLRQQGVTSAGPTSQVLQMKSAIPIDPTHQRAVFIGTASKGIIDKEHQHNAQVYSKMYAPNPFASATDEDIRGYLREVMEQQNQKSKSTSELANIGVANEHVEKQNQQQQNGNLQGGKTSKVVTLQEPTQQTRSQSTSMLNQNGGTKAEAGQNGSKNAKNPQQNIDLVVKENFRTKQKLKRFFSFSRKRT